MRKAGGVGVVASASGKGSGAELEFAPTPLIARWLARSLSVRAWLSLMRRRPRTLALGVWLAARGGAATLGFVVAALGAVASAFLALSRPRCVGDWSGAPGAVPVLASHAIAWSAGVTLALGAAMRAIPRDRAQGVLALARARGVTASRYAWGRVGGLAITIAVAVAGATLVASIAGLWAAGASARELRAIAGALAYALSFAITLAPVAVYTLGGRSRSLGYIAFLLVLVLPELLSPWTAALLPAGWHELTSIPAALEAVREGVAAPAGNGARLARALAGLCALSAFCIVLTMARVGREGHEEAA